MKRTRTLPILLLPIVAAACLAEERDEPAEPTGKTASKLGGIEGTFEAGLDAPWRMEPAVLRTGAIDYGSIPIQLSIHDANDVHRDSGRFEDADGGASMYPHPSTPTIGRFCDITVEETTEDGVVTAVLGESDLVEIESTTGPWTPGGLPPPHTICRPANGPCAAALDVAPTSEWHTGTWYLPKGKMTPGKDIPLTLRARLTRKSDGSCASASADDFMTITNHVRVHLGEAPLPRFDNRWLYGDLHYHSQGTDNEGESGYHYRGVLRAIGALGVDFAVASDHASSSEQIIDIDVDDYLIGIGFDSTGGVLRDMNRARFNAMQGLLWDPNGVNAGALAAGPPGWAPQGYRSHTVIPQLFLGGEVDAIPEVSKDWDGKGFRFGNDLRFDVGKLCGGYDHDGIIDWGSCELSDLLKPVGDRVLIRDVQGIHQFDFGRTHLVYLPRTQRDAFVGSFTGRYGGASRRLAADFDGQQALLPEIERKGYTFLAHPVPNGSCPDKLHGDPRPNGAQLRTSMNGGEGPDVVPYSDATLDDAFKSQAVLGLQLWNEDTRLCTSVGNGDAKEIGFKGPGVGFWGFSVGELENYERYGFKTGVFELSPYFKRETGEFQSWTTSVEWTLHHGAKTWDEQLAKGLDLVQTSALPWLPSGDPRRVFIAGGSDAHGDFNYRREGYVSGTTTISDTALAKVRNLVFVGPPDPYTFTHSQRQVFDALATGNFSVTDGPALRIAIDRNGNGVIDDADTPMGGIVELNGEATLPVLVEWMSTPEFGPVSSVQLYVGVQSGDATNNRASATYAVKAHGPRSSGIADSDVVSSYDSNGRTYALMKDGYTIDPTGLLAIAGAPSMSGTRRINLPVAAFEAGKGIGPDRLYVRAFAATAMKDQAACLSNEGESERRVGACIRRYAFANPVWAVPGPKGKGACTPGRPRALDRDGDGIPDGCDPCPDIRGTTCKPPRPPKLVFER